MTRKEKKRRAGSHNNTKSKKLFVTNLSSIQNLLCFLNILKEINYNATQCDGKFSLVFTGFDILQTLHYVDTKLPPPKAYALVRFDLGISLLQSFLLHFISQGLSPKSCQESTALYC